MKKSIGTSRFPWFFALLGTLHPVVRNPSFAPHYQNPSFAPSWANLTTKSWNPLDVAKKCEKSGKSRGPNRFFQSNLHKNCVERVSDRFWVVWHPAHFCNPTRYGPPFENRRSGHSYLKLRNGAGNRGNREVQIDFFILTRIKSV